MCKCVRTYTCAGELQRAQLNGLDKCCKRSKPWAQLCLECSLTRVSQVAWLLGRLPTSAGGIGICLLQWTVILWCVYVCVCRGGVAVCMVSV